MFHFWSVKCSLRRRYESLFINPSYTNFIYISAIYSVQIVDLYHVYDSSESHDFLCFLTSPIHTLSLTSSWLTVTYAYAYVVSPPQMPLPLKYMWSASIPWADLTSFWQYSHVVWHIMSPHDKTWSVLFQKQVRYMFGSQTDFKLQSISCIKVRTAQNQLLFLPSVTDQTHILLTHCTPARLSWNSYIWYPTWREQRVLIKYSQNYNLFVFVFNSTEVRTETLTIFCVMIPLLVDTWPDFGLFRVVRPYMRIYVFWDIFCWPRMKLCSVFSNVFFKLGR